MEFKIEKREKFNIVGVSKRVPIQFEGENQAIIELAESITEKQRKQMHELADIEPFYILNVSYDFDEGRLEEKGGLTHMIGVATTKENPFDDLEQLTIDESLWAIFPNEGPFPETLQQTHAKIYGEWLQTSDYEPADLPGFSFTKNFENKENVYSEIWMPINKKKAY